MKKILIAIPVLLVLGGGGVVGVAVLGLVKVPFLPFGKKGLAPPADDGKGGPFAGWLVSADGYARQAAYVPPKPPTPPAPPPDPGPGEARLAGLWTELPTDRLVMLVEKWPRPAVGRILALMDDKPVTDLLAALPPEKAADLSRAVASATDEKASKVHPKSEN